MTDFLFILIIFLIVAGGVVTSVFLVRRELKNKREEELAWSFLKQDIEFLKKSFGDGFSQIIKELGQVQEIGHTLRDFQDLLRSPKLRGGIGEQVLKDLLAEVLPKNNFQFQYHFRGGEIVDAIIKTKQGLIPIDSKFPLESFRKFQQSNEKEERERLEREFIRDIKKHIEDISKKYILPSEGTVDFALMYIPSESIYYEIMMNQPDLLDYGYRRKVYFVSPNSFYFFLKTIMMALEGAKIEEASRMILDSLRSIRQETLKFEEELNILFSHINKTKSASERVISRFSRLSSKIENLGILKEKKEYEKLENGEK